MTFRIIPQALEQEILSKHLGGMPTREISRWLLAEHKLTVGYRTVARFLEQARYEQAQNIKASVREKLSTQVLGDLERLEIHAQKLHELAVQLSRKGKSREYRATVEQLRKVAHSRLHFSGADAPDTLASELAGAHERISRRIDAIAARRLEILKEDGDDGGDGGEAPPN